MTFFVSKIVGKIIFNENDTESFTRLDKSGCSYPIQVAFVSDESLIIGSKRLSTRLDLSDKKIPVKKVEKLSEIFNQTSLLFTFLFLFLYFKVVLK